MNKCQNHCRLVKRMVLSRFTEPILPVAYQQVEWIENGDTGRCYIHIDPHVVQGDGYHVTLDFEFVDTIGGSLIGGDTSSSRPYPRYTANFTSNTVAYSGADIRIATVSSGVRYTLEYYKVDSQYYGYLNNTQLSYTSASNSGNDYLSVFYSRYGGYCTPCKLYEATIRSSYNGTELYRLIPCYRKSDNKPGLYNVVTSTFCEGEVAGTDPGTYILGPNV